MSVNKERLIYNAGTFRIDDDLARCRRFIVTMSVLRLPFSARYWNERSNPRKYFLGYMSLFVGDYVERVIALEYEAQLLYLWDNPGLQLYTVILCLGATLTETLVAHRVSIPLAGALVPLPVDVSPFLGCPITFLKFKLEDGCRVEVKAAGEENLECEGISPEVTVPDPSPPTPPYPPEQARDEDPPRSAPEPGEKPGDTAPVTPSDPEEDSILPGIWLLTWTTASGNNTSGTFSGVSTDVFSLSSPSPSCGQSGSSRLFKNGSTVVVSNFNCNSAGFVSTILTQTFTPGSSFRMSAQISEDIHPGDI